MDIKRTYSSIDLIYETQDGYMTISIISDKEWQAVCSALDREDLIDDERFSTALARRKNAELRREVIAAEVSKRATGELLEKLDAADVPCAPLLDRKDLLDHPQIVESGTILREIQEGFGEVRQARPAARFGETPASVRAPAPQLGEHTFIVLQSLGYDQKRCDKLLEGKVVLQSP